MLSAFMVSVIILSDAILSVIILSVFMLCVFSAVSSFNQIKLCGRHCKAFYTCNY
jgi:type III secretory pathway component EscU